MGYYSDKIKALELKDNKEVLQIQNCLALYNFEDSAINLPPLKSQYQWSRSALILEEFGCLLYR